MGAGKGVVDATTVLFNTGYAQGAEGAHNPALTRAHAAATRQLAGIDKEWREATAAYSQNPTPELEARVNNLDLAAGAACERR